MEKQGSEHNATPNTQGFQCFSISCQDLLNIFSEDKPENFFFKFVYMFLFVCKRNTHTHTHTHRHTHTHTQIYIYTYKYIYIYIYDFLTVCLKVCVSVCTFVCILILICLGTFSLIKGLDQKPRRIRCS